MPEISPEIKFDAPSAEVLAADAAFWQLYDSAFPSSEREPRSVILETLRGGAGLTLRARTGARTMGLAIGHMLRHPPVLFVVYLAVAPEFRSHHIGSALFAKLWVASVQRYFEGGLKAEGMVWEVDMPGRAGNEAELEKARRRIGFFHRLGGNVLPAPYFQPPVDGIAPVPMHMMFRPAPGIPLPDGPASAALVRAMYFEKYQRTNGISPAILQELLQRTGHQA
jgi:ribosomal protein S18 acetylase RimI-like enzyme